MSGRATHTHARILACTSAYPSFSKSLAIAANPNPLPGKENSIQDSAATTRSNGRKIDMPSTAPSYSRKPSLHLRQGILYQDDFLARYENKLSAVQSQLVCYHTETTACENKLPEVCETPKPQATDSIAPTEFPKLRSATGGIRLLHRSQHRYIRPSGGEDPRQVNAQARVLDRAIPEDLVNRLAKPVVHRPQMLPANRETNRTSVPSTSTLQLPKSGRA
jgi:hypothetical protein